MFLVNMLPINVTDNLLFPNGFSDKVLKFPVGDFVPWISDHCPVLSTILLNDPKGTYKKTKDTKLTKIPPPFIFDEYSRIAFANGLSSQEMKDKIAQIITSENLTAVNIAAEIKTLLVINAQNCHLNTRRSATIEKPSGPWFDKECADVN